MKLFFPYAVVAFVVAAGCGGPTNKYDAVVTGTVTVDGELANSGTVTFHEVKGGKVAIGRIHPDGSYSLRTGQGDLQKVDGGTVEPGEYIVTVSITAPPEEGALVAEGGPPIPGPSLVATKYASKETSDLKRTVVAGSQVMVLELERAELAPPADDSAEPVAGEEATESGAADSEIEPATDESAQATSSETAPATAPVTEPAAEESEADKNGEKSTS